MSKHPLATLNNHSKFHYNQAITAQQQYTNSLKPQLIFYIQGALSNVSGRNYIN